MMNLNQLLNRRWETKTILRVMAIVTLIGVADTAYLASNYYFGGEVKCLITEGCEVVLTSPYSKILSVPLAIFGLIFYAGMFAVINALDIYQEKYMLKALIAGGIIGFSASLVFLYIQLFVLDALCFYCLISLATSTVLFILAILSLRAWNKNEK